MNKKLLFATVVSALGSFLFGFDTAVISGTTRFITQHFNLTDATLGMTVSIALWGTVVGSIAIGKPGDVFGRRAMLYLCGLLYMVSAIGCALAPEWPVLLISRFLGGIAIGAASVMAPMYIAEIAPARLRGRLVAVAQFNIVAGIMVAFFSNYLLVHVANNWRWMFGVMAVPAGLFFLLLFFVPESPRWLVKKTRVDRGPRRSAESGRGGCRRRAVRHRPIPQGGGGRGRHQAVPEEIQFRDHVRDVTGGVQSALGHQRHHVLRAPDLSEGGRQPERFDAPGRGRGSDQHGVHHRRHVLYR